MTHQNSKGILLESGTNEVEFLRISVAGNFYGVNVAKVSQILLLKPEEINRLPSQPSCYHGVTYFRNGPIPVIDLALALSVSPTTEVATKPLLLVTEFNQRTIGFVIEQVHGIERISWNEFVPLSDHYQFESHSTVVGTVTLGKDIIMILDLEAMMATLDPSMSMDSYSELIPTGDGFHRKNIRVLYAEDSALIQKVLIKTLTQAGFENIQTFPTGKTALDFLSEPNQTPVDIIISDIEMPDMDGLSLCKSLRNDTRYQKTPVVFFSSMINDQMKEKCKAVGGNEAFSKPEVHLIVDAIDRLMKL